MSSGASAPKPRSIGSAQRIRKHQGERQETEVFTVWMVHWTTEEVNIESYNGGMRVLLRSLQPGYALLARLRTEASRGNWPHKIYKIYRICRIHLILFILFFLLLVHLVRLPLLCRLLRICRIHLVLFLLFFLLLRLVRPPLLCRLLRISRICRFHRNI